MPVIPVFRRLRPEDSEYEAILRYIGRFSKKKKKKRKDRG
jgi:hypothetical protein